jgi:mannosyltransferase OCH1-like enzyme
MVKVLLLILVVFFLLVRYEVIILKKHIDYVSIKLPGYSELLNSEFKYTPGGIPKIIIKTSWQPLDRLPNEINDVIQKTIDDNPEYTLYYFTDDDIEQFMKDYSEDIYKN